MDKASDLTQHIVSQLDESARVQQRTAQVCAGDIGRAAEMILAAYRGERKVLLCGNGGSASDAQHIATELMSKLNRDRAALPALALTTNTSLLTAVSNDTAYEQVFVRQIEALGQPGDVLIAISTSGRSANVNAAVRAARQREMQTVALSGRDGGELAKLAHIAIVIPSDSTQRIQEGHITVGHILCDIVEETLFR
ncbi:MAG: SIS domain-containing protein [Thermoflexales bacterium]|nr:SIS domain-containing protein [Thermoflexales bacterium]